MSLVNGFFTLAFQGDGHVVLYEKDVPVWYTGTAGKADPREVVMQGDGNFVAYDTNGRAFWSTETYGNSGGFLELQHTGRLVIKASDGRTVKILHRR